jgi:hypothetical protein
MSARKDNLSEVAIRDTATENCDTMDIQWTTERSYDRFEAKKIVCASITPHPRGKNPHPRNGH